ncbi:GNAT family N-acetyltransferase [Myxococcus sp. K15C18031901]|uniref:GNAT family N-acetyltransferase n=1 Tax=Myxococcus dinghuensis TaxID=2906761 RepID=UPI0020A79712|nr:GNAT family N-acetyltransferase [Myxococcus dinghuensis]MCP3099118.1 GNAT family N-acetyltransferase [Myxococcus dinghuensis]
MLTTTAGEYIIRKAGLAELEDVIRLRLALMCELAAPHPEELAVWAEATRRYLPTALPAGRFHVWLAYVDGEAVACAGLAPYERPPSPEGLSGLEGYIVNMYTAPRWRRRGISRALMTDMLDFARELGLGRLWLHASNDGRPLYEAMGFSTNPTALEWKPGA